MKKAIFLTLLTLLTIFEINAQCIHLYQCQYCGQNSRGTTKPSSGKYCPQKPSLGHSWQDQGVDDPECVRQQNEANQARQKMLADCEKNGIKSFNGGTVIQWYCPSGKPSTVKFPNGIIKEYEINGTVSKISTPKNGGMDIEEYEDGKLKSKGWINSNGNKDGEWFFASIDGCTNCIATYDNGEYLGIGTKADIEKKQQEALIETARLKKEKLQSDEFQSAMNKYQDGLYKTYYGDTIPLSNFLKKYPDALPEYKEQAREAIKNKSDNDAYYFANNSISNYIKYQKNFPNGVHIDEVNKLVKTYVLKNTKELTTTINQKLEEGNATKAIELCELVLRYKNDLHNSQYLPITIYYSLALWSSGNTTKAVEVVKPYTTSVINYSDGDKKFMDKYFIIHDQYKKPLHIDTDKETYKKIKTL
ncbi:MAG: hypothetical protein ACTHJT_12610 [Cytophaga sp.]|uniref:hypothetical protein n=1 Tax=Cytophaga sp. TaxID=29535 RepID=UPI003F7D8966